jgi:predicted MFS family arabinose efflux permease
MMMSAVLAFWSEELFPELPSLGFTAALMAVAAGNLLGSVLGGAMSDAFGGGPLFLGAAAVSTVTALALLPRDLRECAVSA